MLKSLLFAASLLAVASVGAAEPVIQAAQVAVADDPQFDEDLYIEDICDAAVPPSFCKESGQTKVNE